MSMNNCVFSGRLGQDPELKQTQTGVFYCDFSLAVTRPYKDSQGDRITDWIPMVAWRGTAELVCKYFKKGRPMAVTGSLEAQKYTDKDGNKRTSYRVRVDSVSFLESDKRDNEPLPEPPPERKPKDPSTLPRIETDEFRELDEDDDLPF